VSDAMLMLLLALLIVALVGALVFVRWRRTSLPRRRLEGIVPIPGPTEPRPSLPVVLVHGLFGFDRIGVPGARLHYFRGITRHLEGLGCQAYAVRLPRMASVPERAKALVETIAALPHDRVDIIAHSLGGLDARYALAKLGLASRVRTLVTIGTPHRGTPIADLATEGALGIARRAIAKVGIQINALDWLSTSALDRFNRDVVDAPGVRYACVVGGVREPKTPVTLAIVPAHAYLRRVAGPNDGLVPISSQYWGETLAEIEADHFAQVGWRMSIRGTFDVLGLYAFIVARLGDGPPQLAASFESDQDDHASTMAR
jgi:triacylglycerol lipase